MINAKGLEEIRVFLIGCHKDGYLYYDDMPDSAKMLNAWAQEAERQINNGNPPSIELKAWDSVAGHTIEFTISNEGVDGALSPIDVVVEGNLVSAKDANGTRLFSQMGLQDDDHGDYRSWSFWDSGLFLTTEQVEEIRQAVDELVSEED